MSRGHRPTTPTSERIQVVIDDIDISAKIAHCYTKRGAKIMATFREGTAVQEIPAQGQRWIVERIQGFEWILVTRLDTTAEHLLKAGDPSNNIPAMSPGDGHVRLTGTLRIRTGAIDIASPAHQTAPKPLGATYRTRYVADGSHRSWPLSARPVHDDTVSVYNNGTLVDPSTLVYDSPPTTWAASTPYSGPSTNLPGAIVHPTTPNGFGYEAQVGGTSGTFEPTWPTTDFETVVDGTITWMLKPMVIQPTPDPLNGVVVVIHYQGC